MPEREQQRGQREEHDGVDVGEGQRHADERRGERQREGQLHGEEQRGGGHGQVGRALKSS